MKRCSFLPGFRFFVFFFLLSALSVFADTTIEIWIKNEDFGPLKSDGQVEANAYFETNFGVHLQYNPKDPAMFFLRGFNPEVADGPEHLLAILRKEYLGFEVNVDYHDERDSLMVPYTCDFFPSVGDWSRIECRIPGVTSLREVSAIRLKFKVAGTKVRDSETEELETMAFEYGAVLGADAFHEHSLFCDDKGDGNEGLTLSPATQEDWALVSENYIFAAHLYYDNGPENTPLIRWLKVEEPLSVEPDDHGDRLIDEETWISMVHNPMRYKVWTDCKEVVRSATALFGGVFNAACDFVAQTHQGQVTPPESGASDLAYLSDPSGQLIWTPRSRSASVSSTSSVESGVEDVDSDGDHDNPPLQTEAELPQPMPLGEAVSAARTPLTSAFALGFQMLSQPGVCSASAENADGCDPSGDPTEGFVLIGGSD